MADSHDNSVNPLFVGVLGVVSGAIVVAFIHCLAVSCRINRAQAQAQANIPPSRPPHTYQATRGRRDYNNSFSFTGPSSSSSSSSSVTMLGIHKFSKEFKEGTCAVCLGEFEEEDEVRIMPECAHVFHVACIDMWLFSHTNCPLCRANTTPRGHHVIVSILSSEGD